LLYRVALRLAVATDYPPKGAKEVHMQGSSEQIVLTCIECGETLILLGPEEEWRSRRAIFVCGHGHKLTLDGPAHEEILAAS